MTPGERIYRDLLRRLKVEYGYVVLQVARLGDAVQEDVWSGFTRALEDSLKMADIAAASNIRWRGLHQQTIVPGYGSTVNNIIEENAWLKAHTMQTHPMIEDAARRVTALDEDYYLKRWRQGKLDPDKLNLKKEPQYRLDMFRRTTIGDVTQTSQQLELANPEIGVNFPYAEYRSREDRKVRPTHAAMDGFIALRSWRGWSRGRPKNGYNCRCVLRFYARFEAIAKGWMTEKGRPTFETRWPGPISLTGKAAKFANPIVNWENGWFPDKGWHGPKFVANYLPQDVEAA